MFRKVFRCYAAQVYDFFLIFQIIRETSSILMTSDLHLTRLALFLIAGTPRPKGIMPFTFNPILTCHSYTIGPTCRFTKAPAIRKCAHVLGRNFYRELISSFATRRFIVAGLINELPPGIVTLI